MKIYNLSSGKQTNIKVILGKNQLTTNINLFFYSCHMSDNKLFMEFCNFKNTFIACSFSFLLRLI